MKADEPRPHRSGRRPGAVAPKVLATYLAARLVPALATMALTFLCIQTLPAAVYATYSLTLLTAGVAAAAAGGMSALAMLRYARELAPQSLSRGLVAVPLAASALAAPLIAAYLIWRLGAVRAEHAGGVVVAIPVAGAGAGAAGAGAGATSSAAAGAAPGAETDTASLAMSIILAIALVALLALMDTRRSFFTARGRAGAVFALDAWRAGLALVLTALLLGVWGAQGWAPLLAQLLSVIACLLLVRSGPVAFSGTAAAAASVPAKAGTGAGSIDGHDVGHGTRAIDAHYIGYGAGLAGWMAVIVALSLAERSVLASSAGLAVSGRYAAQADVVNAVFGAAGGALGSALMPAYLALGRDPGRAPLWRLLRLGLAGAVAAAGLCLAAGAVLLHLPIGTVSATLTADVTTALVLIAAAAVWMAAGFVQKPLELRGQSLRIFGCVLLAFAFFLFIAPYGAASHGAAGVATAKLAAGLVFCAGIAVLLRTGRPGSPDIRGGSGMRRDPRARMPAGDRR